MTAAHAVLLAGAGLVAGFVNGVVGTGSLVSFPALLAVGYGARVANVTNTVAIIPGYIGNTIGYRRELSGQRARILALGAATVVGSAGGTAALLAVSASTFRSVVPYLILFAAALMAVQTRVGALVAWWRKRGLSSRTEREHTAPLLSAMVLCGAYAAYFGAGVSVVLLAILGAMISEKFQRLNALRSVLTFTGNLLAGAVFALVAHVVWSAAGIMAPATLLGGWAGSSAARRVPDRILRWGVVAFATGVGVALLVT